MKPLLLDLFCCAGGAAKGYMDAGFDVVGVDLEPQPDYPGTFVQGDALDYLRYGHVKPDAVHASPPCQRDCTLTVGTNESRGWGNHHTSLTAAVSHALTWSGVPYVIEQPQGRTTIRRDLTLCGEMFGLGVIRHRLFELGGWGMRQPEHIAHRGRVRGWRHGRYSDGPYVAAYGNGGGKATVVEMQQAMRIHWTSDRRALTEAVPPAYTEYIGAALRSAL
jgi:hypothetical protein